MKKESGQILVESMVAAVVGVVGILGILALLTNSIAKSREVSERFIATFLASEGIEIVRGLVDENYTDGGLYAPWNTVFKKRTNYYRLQNDVSLVDFTCRINGAASNGLSTCFSTSDNEKIATLINSVNPSPLYFNSGDNSYSYDANGIVTPFTRVISITYCPTVTSCVDKDENLLPAEPYKIKFDSIVFWNSQSGPRRIEMEDYANDWRRYDKY